MSFSKFGCSIESNSENGTEKMKVLQSEFPSDQSLPHERKTFQIDKKQPPEVFCKKNVFLKILQISQEKMLGSPF